MSLTKKLLAVSTAVLLGLSQAPAIAAVPNPAPTTYAYGPAGQPIAPLYGGLLGSYSKALTSGTIAAGIAANSPVFSMQYTGNGVAVIKRVIVSVVSGSTAFTAGTGQLSLFAARAFTAPDTGGTSATLTGNNGKLRTSFATTQLGEMRVASTGTLTAGTRTLDTDSLNSVMFGLTTVASSTQLGATELFSAKNAGDYPLVVANNEGVVITVPAIQATGTWQLNVWVMWDEYSAY